MGDAGDVHGECCSKVAPLAISYAAAAAWELSALMELCKNTGVMGGEPGRVLQSPPANTSKCTSSSQPCLMAGYADIGGFAKNTPCPSTGVGWRPQVDGGVEAELNEPEVAECVGVAGW